MNPFDGWISPHVLPKNSDFSNSHKTAHAGPWLDVQVDKAVYEIGLQKRRSPGVLYFLPNDNKHDCSVHCAAVFGLWFYLAIHQPLTRIQPYNTHGRRRAGGGLGRRIDHTFGRYQDSAADKR